VPSHDPTIKRQDLHARFCTTKIHLDMSLRTTDL
jgi:hypothetical protein